jgi:trk system potassium uptake protein TrkA
VAANLVSQGHSVAVIDRRSEAFSRLPDGFTGQTVLGVGFDRERLHEAGIERADAVAAVTSGDNSNIVVARVAREAFGIDRVVARIYDQRRAAVYERLGIPTVATVEWTIERVLGRLLPDVPGMAWIDPSAQICLVERAVPAVWAGHRLDELELAGVALPAGITRLGKATVAQPTVVLQDGDVLWVAVAGDGLDRFDAALAAGPSKAGH